MEKKVNLALIASGSGTDARAIMKAYREGMIPNVDLKILISTNREAGCLEKAAQFDIPSLILDRKSRKRVKFERDLEAALRREQIQLVFLVGCIVKMPLIPGIIFKNIHPADTKSAGGKGMYGLAPHKKVLTLIKLSVLTGSKSKDEVFYTHPTVHGVEEEFDTGMPLLRLSLKIPDSIIKPFLDGKENLENSAVALQAYVLPYEWRLLPLAVEIAAQQILDDDWKIK